MSLSIEDRLQALEAENAALKAKQADMAKLADLPSLDNPGFHYSGARIADEIFGCGPAANAERQRLWEIFDSPEARKRGEAGQEARRRERLRPVRLAWVKERIAYLERSASLPKDQEELARLRAERDGVEWHPPKRERIEREAAGEETREQYYRRMGLIR